MEFPTGELSDRLLFAVPKKGRLSEPSVHMLNGADLHFHRRSRLDIALCTNLPVAIVFLPASDIAKYVASGNVDLGITGDDVITEALLELDADGGPLETEQIDSDGNDFRDKKQARVISLASLGFGRCSLCVQVPIGSGYETPKDLCGKRLVTSFERLTADFFQKLDAEVSAEQGRPVRTTIHYVSGSVEAACALGLADGIVDLGKTQGQNCNDVLVESGETMRAAHLHSIGTILTSEAMLIANPRSKHASLNNIIATRIQGLLAAQNNILCKYNIPRIKLKEASMITPGNTAPTISPLEEDGWVAVEAMVKKKGLGSILDQLTEIGARDILVLSIANTRV